MGLPVHVSQDIVHIAVKILLQLIFLWKCKGTSFIKEQLE